MDRQGGVERIGMAGLNSQPQASLLNTCSGRMFPEILVRLLEGAWFRSLVLFKLNTIGWYGLLIPVLVNS